MQKIEIIKATEDDLPRILEIEAAAISPPWTHGALLGEIYRSDTYFGLAVEDGAILGFVMLRRVGDEGELFQIAVDETARRRGVGDQLLRNALSCAEASGLRKVFLEARKSNNAALELYGKHGFTKAGRRKNYYEKPVEDAVVMSREL